MTSTRISAPASASPAPRLLPPHQPSSPREPPPSTEIGLGGSPPKIQTPGQKAAEEQANLLLQGWPSAVGKLAKDAAGIGPLPDGLFGAAADIYLKFKNGDGQGAIGSALALGLGLAATAACAEFGPAAALCGMVGSSIGTAVGEIFSTPQAGPNVFDTREARFWATYNPLLAQVPDDRAGGGKVYNKAAAQLNVLANLFIDGVDFPSNWCGLSNVTDAPLDTVALPQWQNASTEVRWLIDVVPAAFNNPGEVLPEFATGYDNVTDATHEARLKLWRFWGASGNGHPDMLYPQGEIDNQYVKLGYNSVANFEAACKRVLLAANVERETAYMRIVQSMADVTKAAYMPRCHGSPVCQDQVLGQSWLMAFQTCEAARGYGANGGAPALVVDAWTHLLEGSIKLADTGFDKNVKANLDFRGRLQDKKAPPKSQAEADRRKSKEQTADRMATIQRAAGFGAVGLAVGLGGLAFWRKRKGLPPLPRSADPRKWLR